MCPQFQSRAWLSVTRRKTILHVTTLTNTEHSMAGVTISTIPSMARVCHPCSDSYLPSMMTVQTSNCFLSTTISSNIFISAISRPRFRSVGNKPLPSPRLVSIVVHADVSHLHSRYTLMLMQYGQFLDHDITLTPVNKGVHNIILDCRYVCPCQEVHITRNIYAHRARFKVSIIFYLHAMISKKCIFSLS